MLQLTSFSKYHAGDLMLCAWQMLLCGAFDVMSSHAAVTLSCGSLIPHTMTVSSLQPSQPLTQGVLFILSVLLETQCTWGVLESGCEKTYGACGIISNQL